MNENVLLYGAGVVLAWNAWISLTLIKIMVDVAVIRKQLSGEIL